MVIDDFDLMRMAVPPDETNAPLIIDPDAMLACTIALEGFETIAWWHAQVSQFRRRRRENQFPKSSALDGGRKSPRAFALPYPFRFFTAEFLNHFLIL
jgi:hypothetical protein